MNKPLSREELRLKWVSDCFAHVGHANRKDISAAFGVSDTQATRDLGNFIAAHPGYVKYDNAQKRYILTRQLTMHTSPDSWRDVGYPLPDPCPVDMDDIDSIAQQLADMED